MKILSAIRLILDDQGNHLNSYTISLESFRSFRGPLFHKPVTGQELYFAVSYSKPALELSRLVFRTKFGFLELFYSLLACCHLVKRFQWSFGMSWIENKSYIWTHPLYNRYLKVKDKYNTQKFLISLGMLAQHISRGFLQRQLFGQKFNCWL